MPSVTLAQLAFLFLKLGSTSFGGAMLALIEDSLVHRLRWVESKDFVQAVAFAQLVPGPVTVKVAAYLGYALRGLRGMLVATLCFTLPSAIFVLIGSYWLFRFQNPPGVFQKLLMFVNPIVVAAFIASTCRLGQRVLKNPLECFFAVSAFAAMRLKVSPLLILAVGGVLGLLMYSFRRREPCLK